MPVFPERLSDQIIWLVWTQPQLQNPYPIGAFPRQNAAADFARDELIKSPDTQVWLSRVRASEELASFFPPAAVAD